MSLMAILGSAQNGNHFTGVANACGVLTDDAGGGVIPAIWARAASRFGASAAPAHLRSMIFLGKSSVTLNNNRRVKWIFQQSASNSG